MRILLVPPDTRPPTLDLPVQLGGMTGAEMLVPPAPALPFFFTPGNTDLLKSWLLENAAGADALVVCLETLTLGGMIPARRVSDSLEVALSRLETLREVKRLNPNLRIYAFGVVVRVAHDNDPHEEKPYYGEWGRELRAYSTAFDRHARHGAGEKDALDAAQAALPADIVADWLGTRERNRAVHLAAMDLLKEGILTHLSVTLDDTSEYGLAAFDRRMLEARADELGVWNSFDTYPGADEVPCALLTRALRHDLPPAKAWVVYSGTLGAGAGMNYEDRPAGELVKAHLRGAGCVQARSFEEANFILAVNTPGKRQANGQPDLATVDTPDRHLPAFVDDLREFMSRGLPVSLADIAYPNGAERRLWNLLQVLPLAELAGYSAWNTAGNTLGSAVAFGALAPLVTNKAVQQEAVFSRMVDDALYQAFTRPEVRSALVEPSPFDLGGQREAAEEKLRELMTPRIHALWEEHFAREGRWLFLYPPHLAWPRLFTGVFPLQVSTNSPVSMKESSPEL